MIKAFTDVRLDQCNKDKLLKTPSLDVLKTLTFNTETKWEDTQLPAMVLEKAKIPPMGLLEIHKQGVTGKGINVAIIDQPLALDHPEYKGKIVEYKTFMPENYRSNISSVHGPAVTSLLAGETIGTAPGVNVYYAAAPSWLGDAIYEVNALKWILDVNKTLPEDAKIKFVSVSAAVGNANMRVNHTKWLEMLKIAEDEGVCVVDCTEGNRFVTVGYLDIESNNFELGFPNKKMKQSQKYEVHVPNSMRTFAESVDNKIFGYCYSGVGGLSWGIPYAVGVLCLGQQQNKFLSAFELKELLIESADQNHGVIDPSGFLAMVNNYTNTNKVETT